MSSKMMRGSRPTEDAPGLKQQQYPYATTAPISSNPGYVLVPSNAVMLDAKTGQPVIIGTAQQEQSPKPSYPIKSSYPAPAQKAAHPQAAAPAQAGPAIAVPPKGGASPLGTRSARFDSTAKRTSRFESPSATVKKTGTQQNTSDVSKTTPARRSNSAYNLDSSAADVHVSKSIKETDEAEVDASHSRSSGDESWAWSGYGTAPVEVDYGIASVQSSYLAATVLSGYAGEPAYGTSATPTHSDYGAAFGNYDSNYPSYACKYGNGYAYGKAYSAQQRSYPGYNNTRYSGYNKGYATQQYSGYNQNYPEYSSEYPSSYDEAYNGWWPAYHEKHGAHPPLTTAAKAATTNQLVPKPVEKKNDAKKQLVMTLGNAPKAADENTKFLSFIRIGISANDPFAPGKKIIGPGGCNMKAIVELVPGAKLRLKGNEPNQPINNMPLILYVSTLGPNAYVMTKQLVMKLLFQLYAEYQGKTGWKSVVMWKDHPGNPALNPEWTTAFIAAHASQIENITFQFQPALKSSNVVSKSLSMEDELIKSTATEEAVEDDAIEGDDEEEEVLDGSRFEGVQVQ